VAEDALHAFLHPWSARTAWGVTLAFGGLFAVIYLAFAGAERSGGRRIVMPGGFGGPSQGPPS